MGSKGSSSPQTTTSSSSPPPQVLAEYQGLVDRATTVANQPYQAYQGEQVAPLSYQTQAGLGGINQYANAAQPGYSAALAGTAAAATPVTPNAYSGQALGQFMNPYTSAVVNATQTQFNNQNMQQAQALNSNAIGAGAYLAAKSRRPTRNLVQSAGKFSSSNIRICSNNITGHIPR